MHINIFSCLKKASFLKLNILNDICVVDWVYKVNRFEIIYNFFSLSYALRLFSKIIIDDEKGLHSIAFLYKNST